MNLTYIETAAQNSALLYAYTKEAVSGAVSQGTILAQKGSFWAGRAVVVLSNYTCQAGGFISTKAKELIRIIAELCVHAWRITRPHIRDAYRTVVLLTKENAKEIKLVLATALGTVVVSQIVDSYFSSTPTKSSR